MEQALLVGEMMSLFGFFDRRKFERWVSDCYFREPTKDHNGKRVWAESHARLLWADVFGVLPEGRWQSWPEQRYGADVIGAEADGVPMEIARGYGDMGYPSRNRLRGS